MNNFASHPRSPTANPVKAVLFDLDDTLWPIMPVLIRAEQLLFEWLGQHAPAVSQNFSIDSLRQRRQALRQTNPLFIIDLSALRRAGLTEAFNSVGEDCSKIDAAMALFAEARHAVTPFEDVSPVLSRLKQHFLLGSVSNGFADLDTIGLSHHFKVSIAAHSFGYAKPDPCIFHAACKMLHVQPEEAVYVGDDPLLDVVAAREAGLRSVWINRFNRVLPPGITPDTQCTNLHELETWLHLQAAQV
ncbi:HAD family hydrolase [Glaciimonas immobilis]|uniref:Putative hydrolase of the HAD superfamily n=1 Tax=Glaciimonas immobilis TaxID=728004 RepID=A0A840RY70_9BURK|nr:HAD family hydrolase [Glaciimonas immobilis]KAF3998611.1 HAD family hydrolase [Glaciimonas immobilis]MBB5201471.1 putative hydrolase of the HAD superfamily [Glaciimonas immobilis]